MMITKYRFETNVDRYPVPALARVGIGNYLR